MRRAKLHLAWKDIGDERYWYARETIKMLDPDSGKTKTKRKWHSLGVKGRTKRRTAESALRALEDEMSSSQVLVSDVSVNASIQEYLSVCTASVRPKTLQIYTSWLGDFAGRFGSLQMTEVTPRHVEYWKTDLSKRYAPTSVNIGLRSLRTWMTWATRSGFIERSAAASVKPARVPARTFPPFIPMKLFIEQVLPNVPVPRHRVAFCLAMLAGLRRQEIATLRWSQVDLKRREIRIESIEGFETKSGHGRVIPIYSTLQRELSTLPRKGMYVLGTGSGNVPADASAISHAWVRTVRALRASGLDIPAVSLHGLRHSFATWLAGDAGLSLHALRALLGHSNIQTTMIYAHIQPQIAVEQARRVDV